MDKTLLKGLQVLEAIADTESVAHTISEVAERVGLTRSNAHRTLQTLMHAGFVERHPVDGSYRATMKMFAIGARQMGQPDMRRIAPAFMDTLVKESGETAHLAVLNGAEVIYVDKVDSFRPVQAHVLLGTGAPSYLVASGKALLAAHGPLYVEGIASQLHRAEAPAVDWDALKVELAEISRRGYATNRGDWREDVGGVAAPVFDRLQRPVAALGISGPLDRLRVSRVQQLAPLVVKAANQLSEALGYARGRGPDF